MRDILPSRLGRFLARTRNGFERLEAIQFAAPSRDAPRRPGVRGTGQA